MGRDMLVMLGASGLYMSVSYESGGGGPGYRVRDQLEEEVVN